LLAIAQCRKFAAAIAWLAAAFEAQPAGGYAWTIPKAPANGRKAPV
jgi:hypothetical protein